MSRCCLSACLVNDGLLFFAPPPLTIYVSIHFIFGVCVDNGFSVEAQRREPLAEDVFNFLGCAASDGAAGALLR